MVSGILILKGGNKMEYRVVGHSPSEILVYEAIMTMRECEQLLTNNSNATILVDKSLKLTKEHEELARSKHIQIFFVEPKEVKVVANKYNNILNKPLA